MARGARTTSSIRAALLLALAPGVALPVAAASATPAAPGVTSAHAAQEGDEILLEVAYVWRLKGDTITGTVTNGDRSAVTGTAKITRETSTGTPITLASGGRLSVAPGRRQVLRLTLTRAGRAYFRHRARAALELALDERAGTRTGDIGEDIVVRKAA